MDEFVRKAAGFGFPMIILLITMATTGLTGAAAITASLALLGPGGMIGGIIFLGMIGIAADMLSKFGLETLLEAIYTERLKNGEALRKLLQEIQNLPIFGGLRGGDGGVGMRLFVQLFTSNVPWPTGSFKEIPSITASWMAFETSLKCPGW